MTERTQRRREQILRWRNHGTLSTERCIASQTALHTAPWEHSVPLGSRTWSAFGAGSPQPKLLMFEGSERRAASLSGVGFPYVISVVGPQADRIEFYDSPGGGTGNSVLKENTKHYADVAPQQTVARTLDELLEAAMGQGIVQRPVPLRGTLLKLDVQVRSTGGRIDGWWTGG